MAFERPEQRVDKDSEIALKIDEFLLKTEINKQVVRLLSINGREKLIRWGEEAKRIENS